MPGPTVTVDELRAALAHGLVIPHYQPSVDLHSGRVSGVEALARLMGDDGRVIMPGAFLPVAAANGMLPAIGDAMLRAAASDAAAFAALDVRVWVNLSGDELADPASLLASVERVLEITGCPPRALGFEVTETTLIDVVPAREVLNALRAKGIAIALDDFGTGYSSLTHLRELPIDWVKVDRSFVSGASDSLADAAIVEALCELSHAFDLSVVAEGVETDQQLAQAARLGVDKVQGWYFSKALPAPEALAVARVPWCGKSVTLDRESADRQWATSPRSRLLLSALDALPVSVVVHDDARVLYVNSAFGLESGFTPDDILGRSPSIIAADAEGRALHAAGHRYDLEQRTVPVRSERGATWLSIRRDVTAEHALADRLDRQRRSREAVIRFTQTCLSLPPDVGLEHQGLLDGLVVDIADVLRPRRVFLDLVDREAGTLATAAHWWADPTADPTSGLGLGRTLPLTRFPRLVAALEERGTLVWDGTGPLPDWLAETSAVFGQPPGPQILTRIQVRGQAHGVIGAEDVVGSVRSWEPDEIGALVQLAASAGALADRHRARRLSKALMNLSTLAMSAPIDELTADLNALLTEIAQLHRADVAFVDVIEPVGPGRVEYRTLAAGRSRNSSVGARVPTQRFDADHPWFIRLGALQPFVIDDATRSEFAWVAAEHPSVGTPSFVLGRAQLRIPFAVDGVLAGAVGLVLGHRARTWHDDEIEHVQALATVFSTALGRQRALAALAQSEQRFRTLAETSLDVIVAADAEGVVTYISPSTQEVFGHPPTHFVGVEMLAFVHPEDLALIRPGVEELHRNGHARIEYRQRRADGELVWCQTNVRMLRTAAGDPDGYCMTLRDVTDLHRRAADLARRADIDEVTQVASRATFRRELTEHLEAGQPLAVLVVDLEGFRATNAEHGHAVGDAVLRIAAERLSACIRASAGDLVARIGADEFVLLCPGAGPADAATIAGRAMARLAEAFDTGGADPMSVQAAIGVIAVGAVADTEVRHTPADVLRGVERAISAAKQAGPGVLHQELAAPPAAR